MCVSLLACGEDTVTDQPKDTQATQGTGSDTNPTSGDPTAPTDNDDDNAAKNPTIPMSNDLKDFTVRIDGTVYQFPRSTQVFLNDGWTPALTWVLEDDYMVEPGSTANTDVYRKSSSETIFLLIYNPGKSACKYSECVVYGVYLSKSCNVDAEFSNGLKLGDSTTVEDILAGGDNFYDEGYGVVKFVSKGNKYNFEVKDDVLVYVQVETKKEK